MNVMAVCTECIVRRVGLGIGAVQHSPFLLIEQTLVFVCSGSGS